MANILMVVSAADALTRRDGREHPTGYWAEEVVVSHKNLLDAGHTVRIATPGGMKPTVDQVSLAAESAAETTIRMLAMLLLLSCRPFRACWCRVGGGVENGQPAASSST